MHILNLLKFCHRALNNIRANQNQRNMKKKKKKKNTKKNKNKKKQKNKHYFDFYTINLQGGENMAITSEMYLYKQHFKTSNFNRLQNVLLKRTKISEMFSKCA